MYCIAIGNNKNIMLPNTLRYTCKHHIALKNARRGVQKTWDIMYTPKIVCTYKALCSLWKCCIINFDAASLIVEALDDFSTSDIPFTLTCISRNRPATTVQWYFNDERLSDADTTSEPTDPVTSRYRNTLTVNERMSGEYKCVVFTTSNLSMITTYGNATINVYSTFNWVIFWWNSMFPSHISWNVVWIYY